MNYYLNPISYATQPGNRASGVANPWPSIFGRFWETTSPFGSSYRRTPNATLETVDDHHSVLRFEVPGFNDSSLKVSVVDNILNVRGNLKSEAPAGDKDAKSEDERPDEHPHHGYARASFERQLELGEGVEVKSAALRDGVLRIELESQPPAKAEERVIKIKRG